MPSAYPRIDVEETLDDVIRDYGGVVLKEKLPKSPRFNNADYIFHFEKIVGELKCLNDDNVHSPENRLRTTALESFAAISEIGSRRIVI